MNKDFELDTTGMTSTEVIAELQRIQEEQLKTYDQDKTFDYKKAHVHICVPCYGGLILESTMTSLIRFILTANHMGLGWSLDTMANESLITRARNNLMAKMMSNPAATHFMFIDADIRFEPDAIFKLVAADKDIVAGMYPKKSYPIELNINLTKNTKIFGPLVTVSTAATGFLMFKRKVYEDLIAAHPETKYIDDIGFDKTLEPYMYAIFDCYINEDGHYLSEDWAFCERAKKLGYDIWVDTRINLGHTGSHEFRRSP